MKLRFPNNSRGRLAWGSVVLAGALAVSAQWLNRFRLTPPERQAPREVRVTSGADSGPGTLREAIFAADRAQGRARVVIEVNRIVLETPLPPLVNPDGVILEARSSRTELDASRMGNGPVLDVAAPGSVIIGLRIVRALDQALLIRGSGTRLRDLSVEGSGVGVFLTEGAGDFALHNSSFSENEIGVQLPPDASLISLQNNRFSSHRRAAVWAVAPSPSPAGRGGQIDILENQFHDDYQSLVLINMAASVDRNVFRSAHNAAIHVSGVAATIRGNRMREGRGFGIYADDLAGGLITDNEIDHNCAGGVILRRAHNTQVVFNRIYANGYGVVMVLGQALSPITVADNLIVAHAEDGLYVIGGSPILRRNRLLQNRHAGVRLSALHVAGRRPEIPAPLLEANVIAGNGNDELRRDDYRADSAELSVSAPTDCSWRLAGAPERPVLAVERS